MCPKDKTDFPQEYFPSPIKITFPTDDVTIHEETEIPMDNFFMAWTAYEFYYGRHYFFGGEDLREDKKRYNNYVFEFVGDKMETLNIELPWAEFSRVSSAIHEGEVWLCGSSLGCPNEKKALQPIIGHFGSPIQDIRQNPVIFLVGWKLGKQSRIRVKKNYFFAKNNYFQILD